MYPSRAVLFCTKLYAKKQLNKKKIKKYRTEKSGSPYIHN